MRWGLLKTLGSAEDFKRWRRETVKGTLGRLIWSCEQLVNRYSLIADKPAFDAAEFPWTAVLERNADVIRCECEAILQFDGAIPSFHELSPDQKSISSDERWKTYLLFGMGQKGEGNCARCPETTRVLESIPGMTTAFFSILSPGKHIPPHRGIFKGFVRCHLGLLIPERQADCYMRIEDVNLHWQPGKCIVFDDTYEHEVYNNTDEIRVVLLIDVLRPMRYPGRVLTRALMWIGSRTAYVQDTQRNYFVWEKRFEEAWNEGRKAMDRAT